jgi:hypothetical protein
MAERVGRILETLEVHPELLNPRAQVVKLGDQLLLLVLRGTGCLGSHRDIFASSLVGSFRGAGRARVTIAKVEFPAERMHGCVTKERGARSGSRADCVRGVSRYDSYGGA